MLREFTDADGVHWRVWDVNPSIHERPSRALKDVLRHVPDGWLAFETEGQRRRLHPIPPEWEVADAETLARLCARAAPVLPRDPPSFPD